MDCVSLNIQSLTIMLMTNTDICLSYGRSLKYPTLRGSESGEVDASLLNHYHVCKYE